MTCILILHRTLSLKYLDDVLPTGIFIHDYVFIEYDNFNVTKANDTVSVCDTQISLKISTKTAEVKFST